jgi:3-phenylpropionate/trans-cinnamate dioxygenase ferredoxin reductase subunit
MPDESVEILLVGGGVASVRCARALRRHGHAGSIVIVGEEPHPPYNRPPLSKELLRDDAVAFDLVAAEPSTWYERRGIELRTGSRVAQLEPGERLVTLTEGGRIRYERCLIATGAVPRRPPIPGAEHAYLLRNVDDARAIREQAVAGARAVLIGGGFIGVEVAASLAARGVAVTLIELGSSLWAGQLGSELSEWAVGVLTGAGVAVRLATAATRIEPDAVHIGGERLAADLVVAGVGVAPREDLGRAAGIDGSRVEHWHAAREGGERAALAMLGLPVPAQRAPWVFSEFAGQQLDVVGLPSAADQVQVIGNRADGPFVEAFVRGGRVAAVGIVNTAIDVEQARRLVEHGARWTEFHGLAVQR